MEYSSLIKDLIKTKSPHGLLQTFFWFAGILVTSLTYYLLYNFPVSLHDIAHYIVSGVSEARDHKDLIYPYNPDSLDGLGPSYSLFQKNLIHFDSRINFPSKLYSILYGFFYNLTGHLKFIYAQYLTFGTFIFCNIFLYLIGRRFFSNFELFCFLITVMFLPVMRFNLNPGNDVFGYASFLFLLWMSLSLRVNIVYLGIITGILCHFRAQSLAFILTLPFIISASFNKKLFSQSFLPLFIWSVSAYLFVGLIFKL
jgi:hypothetical protein